MHNLLSGIFTKAKFRDGKREEKNNTVKPVYNDHLMGYFSAYFSKGHLDELQKAEIVSKSKLVHSVFIKTHYWINHR